MSAQDQDKDICHCPVFETQVVPRISIYSWNKKQQHFDNSKSRIILRITRPKLSRHYRWDKLRMNSVRRKMAAQFNDDDDNLCKLARISLFLLGVKIGPPRSSKIWMKSSFVRGFEILVFCKQFGVQAHLVSWPSVIRGD